MVFVQVLKIFTNWKSTVLPAVFFCIMSCNQLALSAPNSNMQIIDSLLVLGYTQLFNNYHLEGQDTLDYMFSEMPNYDYFEQLLLNTADNHNIQIRKANPTNVFNHYFKIFPVKIEILYKENNDNYTRTISINMNSAEFLPNGAVKNNFEHRYTFNDSLSEMDLNYIEDVAFPISKGKKEEKKLSFFDKILEPAIIVATSAITVILFFTVRSK